MKLKVFCAECRPLYVDELALVEQRDDGLYSSFCPKGHNAVVSFQNYRFELLLDSGGMALLDGYKYEAVSSIAASYERFLEFYVKVIVRKHSVSVEEFEKAWKLVRRQSERQLGSFLFVSLFENKCCPDFLEEKWFKFRNKVIHQGYVPATEEVKEYAERIFRLIRDLLDELKTKNQDAISFITMEMNRRASEAHSGARFSIQCIPTMICHTYPTGQGPQSFEEGLAHLQQVKPRAYGV